MNTANLIQTLAIYALPVLFAITAHEAAHGYVARMLGDNTAWLMGRVTLNPAKHIDPIGTVLMPLLLFLAGSPFLFGYAKPVPIRFGSLRHPKRDMVWVALAGPGANLVQVVLWQTLLIVLNAAGVSEPFVIESCQAGIQVNLVMFAFNLFPVPPLDGGRVLIGLLPTGPAMALARVEPWGFFIVMGLVVARVISEWWMLPLMTLTGALVDLLTFPLIWLLH